jgi:hypothetical protein
MECSAAMMIVRPSGRWANDDVYDWTSRAGMSWTYSRPRQDRLTLICDCKCDSSFGPETAPNAMICQVEAVGSSSHCCRIRTGRGYGRQPATRFWIDHAARPQSPFCWPRPLNDAPHEKKLCAARRTAECRADSSLGDLIIPSLPLVGYRPFVTFVARCRPGRNDSSCNLHHDRTSGSSHGWRFDVDGIVKGINCDSITNCSSTHKMRHIRICGTAGARFSPSSQLGIYIWHKRQSEQYGRFPFVLRLLLAGDGHVQSVFWYGDEDDWMVWR